MTSTRREVILIPYDTQRPIPSLYYTAATGAEHQLGETSVVYGLDLDCGHVKLQLAPLCNQ